MYLRRKDMVLSKVKGFREWFDKYAELQAGRFKSYETDFVTAMGQALAYEEKHAPEKADDTKVKGMSPSHVPLRLLTRSDVVDFN